MSRGAGGLTRAEDWIIAIVSVMGLGATLNEVDPPDEGGGSLSIFDDWRGCLGSPIECAKDTFARFHVRQVWIVGLIAVAVTVALRRLHPKLAGVPYAVLFGLVALAITTGRLDAVLRSLDPRRVLEGLAGLFGGAEQAPAVVVVPPSSPPPPAHLNCVNRHGLCASRGGTRQLLEVVDAQGNRQGCGQVICRDGSLWDGNGGRLISEPPRCYTVEQMDPRRHLGVRQLYSGGPGRCGVVIFNDGAAFDLATGKQISESYLRSIMSMLNPISYVGG